MRNETLQSEFIFLIKNGDAIQIKQSGEWWKEAKRNPLFFCLLPLLLSNRFQSRFLIVSMWKYISTVLFPPSSEVGDLNCFQHCHRHTDTRHFIFHTFFFPISPDLYCHNFSPTSLFYIPEMFWYWNPEWNIFNKKFLVLNFKRKITES